MKKTPRTKLIETVAKRFTIAPTPDLMGELSSLSNEVLTQMRDKMPQLEDISLLLDKMPGRQRLERASDLIVKTYKRDKLIHVNIEGKVMGFNCYELSYSYGDLSVSSEEGYLSFAIDWYGDNPRLELIDWELRED